jgi:hypothetical protein
MIRGQPEIYWLGGDATNAKKVQLLVPFLRPQLIGFGGDQLDGFCAFMNQRTAGIVERPGEPVIADRMIFAATRAA